MERSNVRVLRRKDLWEREALVQGLRRRFERASRRRAGRPWLARLGRRAMVVYWCVCLTVLGLGLNQLHPEFRRGVGEALHAAAANTRFPNCTVAHAFGYYDIPRGSPAYTERQDGDGDGFACEPFPRTRTLAPRV